ncbi:Vacuolar protein-sorting-associated protein 27 [Rhizophlyctis rosea]|nr:Vacuolar protein-sorting-associated protein 27 [Rhizophlyctis rosea]
MFQTTTAPEWTDSDLCMRCRTPFTTFNRKHHCRNCGQTFCGACSSKLIALPHIGITQEVRVCDGCYSRVSSGRAGSLGNIAAAAAGASSSSTSTSTTAPTTTRGESDMERKEREELERAIAASLETAKKSTAPTTYSAPQPKREEPKPRPQPTDDSDDEDLKKAIEASLQDLKVDDYTSSRGGGGAYPSTSGGYSAPSSGYGTSTAGASPVAATPTVNVNELSSVELENIRMFSELVERTEADVAARGMGGLNAGGLQAMYAQIATTQPKLLTMLSDTSSKYQTFMEMHDKLTEAVRIYDSMLEQRLRSAGPASSSYAGYATPPVPAGQYGAGYGYEGGYYQGQQQGYAPPPAAGQGQGGEGYGGGYQGYAAPDGGQQGQQPQPQQQQQQQPGYEYPTSPQPTHAQPPPTQQSSTAPAPQGQNYTYTQPPPHSFAPPSGSALSAAPVGAPGQYGSPPQGGYAPPPQGYAPQQGQQQGYEGYGYYAPGQGQGQGAPQQQQPQPQVQEAPLIEL